MEHVPVVVVGGGPTGLTLASELLRHGVRPLVLDRELERPVRARAVDIQSRSLEIFDEMGIAAGLLAAGRRLSGFTVYDGASQLCTFNYRAQFTTFPFALALPQNETEEALERLLLSHGGTLEKGANVEAIDIDAEVAVVEYLCASGARKKVSTSWLVGCDGAESLTRRMAGIGAAQVEEAAPILVVEGAMQWSLPPAENALFTSPRGYVMVLPLPGNDRVVRMLVELRAGSTPDMDDPEAIEGELSQRMNAPVRFTEPPLIEQWWGRRQVAETFVRGRVLLAGDAAHTSSPVGGHGMNQGIQDAHNLAWKLALVVRDRAHPSLLASYDAERRPAAKRLLDEMDIDARLRISNYVASTRDRGRLVEFVRNAAPFRRAVLDAALSSTTHYERSPLSGEILGAEVEHGALAHAPMPGQRVQDLALTNGSTLADLRHGVRHDLFLFTGKRPVSQDISALLHVRHEFERRFSDLFQVHLWAVPSVDGLDGAQTDADFALHRHFGAKCPAGFVLRPDGFVAYRAMPVQLEPMMEWAERLFR